MERIYYAAADVGGTKIALGLFDRDKRLLDRVKLASNPELPPEEFFSGMVQALDDLCAKNGAALSQLAGLGVGVPGMVRFYKGEVALCAMLPQLNGFRAAAFLEGLLPGTHIVLDNDGHCAALAESRQGAGKGFPHMLYCPVSTGLSSGIIIDGNLFRGSDGFAGESGHTIVSPGQGIPCGCGNPGCVQSYCSGGMIVRHIQNWIAAGEETQMLSLAGGRPEDITARHLEEAARRGDPLALKALDQMALYLGVWIFNLYMTLNINCFVFGGGLINMGDLLFSRVRQVFDGYSHTREPVYFKFAQLSQDSGLIGALELLF